MAHRTNHDPDPAYVKDTPATDRVVRDDTSVTENRYRSEDVAVTDTVPYGRDDYSLAGRINTVLFAVLVALEGLLTLRFALVAFGANRGSGFVDFVLDLSWPFVRPFDGAFANRTWDQGLIEVSTLLAMGIFALIFAIVAMLLSAALPRVTGYDRQERVERRSVTHQGGH